MEIRRFLYLMRCSLRVCFIVVTNLYCIPTYLLWMWVFFLPFRLLNYPTYWYVEGIVYKWLLNVVASWSWGAKYQIIELGDEIDPYINDRCLFLVNHQSTADVPLLMLAFNEKSGVLQSIMWIMDRMFRYTNFGAVSVTHGDYFITQGKHVRDSQMKKLRDHLLNIFIGRNRRWIILFPEGGFLSKRKEVSVRYAQKNNFPILDRVTLPRVGAMDMILDTLRPENIEKALDNGEIPLLYGSEEECSPLKWVFDVTVAYPEPENPLDLLAICAASRPPCKTYMHYRRYAVEDVPCSDMDSLRDWVYARWCEKEELLNEYYETKTFPLVPKSQRINEKITSSTESSQENESVTLSEVKKGSTESSQEAQFVTMTETNNDSTANIDSSQKAQFVPTSKINKDNTASTESLKKAQSVPTSLTGKDSTASIKLRNERYLTMSYWWIAFLHFFFISSSVIHCYLLSKMWDYVRT